MTDRPDEFERRLSEDLRAWSEPATRRADWSQEAREVIADAGGPGAAVRPSRLRVVALGTAAVVLAAGGTVAAISLLPEPATLGNSPPPTSGPPATTSAAVEPSPTPPPSTLPASALPLSELAWWNLQSYDFGLVEPAPSDAPPLLEPYKLLRIGTLDGRINAELRLNPNWSHSSVTGPVGTDVLVANNDRSQTSVYVVSANDGARTDLFATSDLIPAAVLSWDGQTVFYVKADRSTGADGGLWSRPRAGGPEAELAAGPLGQPLDVSEPFLDTTVWWLSLSPGGETIVVQWCRGEAECRTHLVNLATGGRREATGAGWPIGITDRVLVARGTPPQTEEIVAVDFASGETRMIANWSPAQVVRLGTGWWLAFVGGPTLIDLEPGDEPIRSIPGGGPGPSGEIAAWRVDRFGQALPDGWMLRWLENGDTDPPGQNLISLPGQLVNIATGERLTIGTFAPLSP